MAQQDVEVLNRRDQILLDLHAPQPAPSRAIKPIAGPAGEGAFHEMLAHPDIPAGRRGATACPHVIERVLLKVPFNRAPHGVVGALTPERTGLTDLFGGRVVEALTTEMQGLAPQHLASRTAIRIRRGLVGELGIDKVLPLRRPLVSGLFQGGNRNRRRGRCG